VHPPCKSHLGIVQSLRATDGLAACPPRLSSSTATIPTKFQLKFGEASKDTGHHPANGVRGVDSLAKGTQHDAALAKLTDGRHDLGGVTAQAVDTDHHDGVAFSGIVQQRSKAGTLLASRSPSQLV
jgi:hypothetical protein